MYWELPLLSSRRKRWFVFAHSSYMFIVSFLALLRKWGVTSTRFAMFYGFMSRVRVRCYLDRLDMFITC